MSAALFKKKALHRNKQILLVTLRSGSISFAVVLLSRTKPVIAFEKTTPIPFKKDGDAIDFVCQTESVITNQLTPFITEAIAHFTKQNIGALNLREVSVSCTAPWYSIATQDVVLEEEKPFTLAEKKFTEIVESQVAAQHKENTDLIEKHITHVILNGYELTNPFKKEATNLTMSVYMSFFEKKCREMIFDQISNNTGVKNTQFRTQPLISFLALRDMLYMHHSYAHISVHSENTEISIIKQGAITSAAQIPRGKRWIVEKYMKEKECTEDIAVSNIARFNEKDFKKDAANYATITDIEKKWATSLITVLQDEDIQIPNYVYVSGDPVVQKVIVHGLKSDEVTKKIYSQDARVVVTPLTPAQFTSHVTWNKEQLLTVHTDVILHAYFVAMEHAL